jgi:RNA polymerase I-specific transcription initiation factor RRN7
MSLVSELSEADRDQMIVKDLWTYQLAISALPPPPNLPESAHSQSTFKITQSQPNPSSSSSVAGLTSTQPPKQDNDDTSDEDENNDSGEDKEYDEPEVDPELLEEMSQLSDMSDKEEDVNQTGRRGGKGKVRKKRRLKVSDTLVVLSVGLWMIRKGIMCVDIEE